MKHLLKSCYCGYSYYRHRLAVALCFLTGERLKQRALPGSQGGEGGWIKGGGMNPKMENPDHSTADLLISAA